MNEAPSRADPPRETAAVAAPWHALPVEETLARLSSDLGRGLTRDEAARRIETYGRNELTPPERRGPLMRFLLQFHDVLIYVLLAAAVGTALLGDWLETAVILGVVVINALIGFIQEGKAEQALESIRGMLSQRAIVLRDGERVELPAEEVVPGDVVFLESGDRVPADLRLARVKNLQTQEAALTGESVAVQKAVGPVAEDAPIGDRSCMAYSGTLVASGRGVGAVVATGDATEIGRIGAMVSEVEELTTPLLKQVAAFGRRLTVGILLLTLVTCVIAYFLRGFPIGDTFLIAVGIAVAAIPEGLPAVMTITLAIGVRAMARRKAIIRRLPAVETLGSVTVICTDKTGTLTRNEMTVQTVATADDIVEVSGVGYAPNGELTIGGRRITREQHNELHEMARAALLCNDAELREEGGEWRVAGDPTEGALLTFGRKAGLEREALRREFRRVDAIPFESERRFMATLHRGEAGHGFIYVKGAPERVLAMCRFQRSQGEDRPLDAAFWRERIDELAARGQRVLAAACKAVPGEHRELGDEDVEHGLSLLGLFGLIDPPREEAKSAIRDCQTAGIRVKMITGDHGATARAIGEQLGLANAHAVLVGPELDRLDEEELRRRAPEVDVFARAAPEHKLRLVGALQSHGHVVAMTGDGVNDAPALKRADIGIAMGQQGTEAAKEAADMVLADDNFATIANAVEEGRTVYDNLKKAILFLLPANGAQAFVLVVAVLLGQAMPITPLQILWVNMAVAVTLGLALAFEPAERDVLRRPPRASDEPLLSAFAIWRIAFVSALNLAVTYAVFLWEMDQGAPIETARTAAVNTLVAAQAAYLLNARHLLDPAYTREGFLGNRYALAAIGTIVALQLLFTYAPPLQFLFSTNGIAVRHWGIVLSAAVAVFVAVEVEKAVRRRRRAAAA